MKKKIIVLISGGLCQAIFSEEENLYVIIIDEDNINAGDEDPRDDPEIANLCTQNYAIY